MPGVKGKSGAPGRPKTDDHRARIAAAMKAYWQTPEGIAERLARREQARMNRLHRRMSL